MARRLIELDVENFRSLRNVSIPLGPLNVMVGPNGVGKTNVLEVFRFLADVIRTDLLPALEARGGFAEILFAGGDRPPASLSVNLKATWTRYSSLNAPDEYGLRITRRGHSLSRNERFQFKRTRGRGRRITIGGQRAAIVDTGADQREQPELSLGIQTLSSGLSTLPRLSDQEGGAEVAAMAEHLASFRVFDVGVDAARTPSSAKRRGVATLRENAGNLSAFLLYLREHEADAWEQLQEDAVEVLPQLDEIDFEFPSGPAREVVTVLREKGLRRPTQLADASFGTIRLLGLLALLYDPDPPALTCIEEIDHGLHPQALELLVKRLRAASERTQFLIATHSPAFADRLTPEELIVCERHDDGASVIPVLSLARMNEIVDESEGLPLGELWFSGALGGDL